ncbi:MAG TPA: molybdenum cofactor guanylyltransferase [Nitrospirota bacterium]|nr:molybdenum cofactor guanylyltransferase [Nitrospirota bacterium]
MTGIVLAGGENRRMGKDKAFLRVAGMPMIEHVLRALRKSVERIIIVTNSPGAYTSYDALVITDACGKRGPLTGIYSGLLHSRDEYNVVVACDMPFLNPRLLSYMTGLAGEYDAILPKIGDFIEPLHAVYRRELLLVIEDHLKKEQQRIQNIFTGLRVRYITEKEIDRFDPQRRSFINLNTPEEYKEATCSD